MSEQQPDGPPGRASIAPAATDSSSPASSKALRVTIKGNFERQGAWAGMNLLRLVTLCFIIETL
ncbi:MAG: hypothetical protein ACM3WS_00795 [Bacillota bacterium]